MKLYSLSEASEFLNINRMTLHTWCHKNLIKFKTLPNGHRRFLEDDLLEAVQLKNKKNSDVFRKNVVYCRVSTTMQKDNLERQKQRMLDFCASKGLIISDCLVDVASGMNFNRPNFKKLIFMILSKEVDTIFVEYKDRLVRFGFDLILHMCSYNNTKIVIVNSDSTDYKTEIVNDMMAIIHHFCMRLYGARKTKIKLNQFKKDLKISEMVENENISN